MVSGDRRFTYAEFGERCERLAAGLLSLGVQPATASPISASTTTSSSKAITRLLLAGAISMPLNVRLTPAELTGILNHAEPRVVILRVRLRAHRRPAPPRLPRRAALDRNRPAATRNCSPTAASPAPTSSRSTRTRSRELFYTSGSTGTPKGVTLSHRTLYMHALAVVATFAHTDENVELHTIPLFHANGWGRAHSSVMMGLTQVMVRRFEPATVLLPDRGRSAPPAWRSSPPWRTRC